jgi:hypothetical protein
MPTIGHRIQVDAASGVAVFRKEMPTQMQMRDKKKSAPRDREARLVVVMLLKRSIAKYFEFESPINSVRPRESGDPDFET